MLRKTGKVSLYILGGILLLICLAIFFINTPYGKKVVKNQVQSFLTDKLKTPVKIGSIDYSLPNWVEIKGVFFQDLNKDTLLYGEELKVNLKMFKLLRGNTDIERVFLKNIVINVNRKPTDTTFNFQYILDAFTGNQPTTANPDTAALKLTLDQIVLDNVAMRFKDDYGKSNFVARIKNLDAKLTRFQPDRLQFEITDFLANGVDFFMRMEDTATAENVPVQIDADTTSTPYDLFITAGNINLRDVNVMVEDKGTGMFYSNDVTSLVLSDGLFDMNNFRTSADKLQLDSSLIEFISPKALVTQVDRNINTDTLSADPWEVKVNTLLLKNNSIRFDDPNLPKTGGLDFAHLSAQFVSADIRELSYAPEKTAAIVNHLSLKEQNGFVLDSTRVNFVFSDTVMSATDLFVKTPGSLLRNSIQLRYDSIGAITTSPASTVVSAVLENSTLSFNDLYQVLPSMKESFPPASFANQVVRFNTELRGSLARVVIPFLQLSGLSGSTINARGTLYNLTDAERFAYDLTILNSRIKKQDLLRFVPPENQETFANLPPEFILKGTIKGTTKDLDGVINASGNGVAFSGKIGLRNITDPAKMQYTVAMQSGTFSKDFILGFIPPGTLPPEFNLPDQITARGSVGGNVNDLTADVQLITSFGNADIKGFIKNISDPQRADYDLDIQTRDFNIGMLTGQDSIFGRVTTSLSAKGVGFDYKTMVSQISANVASLEYNGYTYQNADITAAFNRGSIVSEGKINDPSLKLNYDIDANLAAEYPVINGFIRVDTAELYKLNLYPDTLNFSLTTAIRAGSLVPRQLDAETVIDSIRFTLGATKYRLDSIELTGKSNNGIDSIFLKSEFANLFAGGAFDYDQVGTSIMQYIDRFYDISLDSSVNVREQQVAFGGTVEYHPLITGFVPMLNNYQTIQLNGSYNTEQVDSTLKFELAAPYLSLTSGTVSNANIKVNSEAGQINYQASADTLSFASSQFFGTRVNGDIAEDSLNISAVTQDDSGKDWFGLTSSLHVNKQTETYSVRLSDTLLLNYANWSVDPNNYIEYSPNGIIVNDLSMISDTARIIIDSEETIPNSPIAVTIDNFGLGSLSSFLSPDTTFLHGNMDARLTISNLEKEVPGFTGYAYISNLALQNQPVGDLEFYAANETEDAITSRIYLTGNGNDVSSAADYNLRTETVDANIDITRLNFETLQGLSAGQLVNSSGSIRGNVKLTGNIANPQYNGEIIFDTAQFALAMFGAPYKINDERITLQYPYIRFDDFTIRDSLNNEMKIQGNITSRELMKYDLNLDIDADDFIVINAPKAIGNEIYGFGSIDANITIQGTSEAPEIEGDVLVNDNSDITIVLPERSFDKDASKSIVRFIDADTFNVNTPEFGFREEAAPASMFARFLNYNLNLEMNKEAVLRILVDPATGDEMVVQGDAELNAGVDPGGNIVLAGTYTLEEGSYVLNYQFLQRKFNLIKGSTITFAGEPMNARVDVTAEYIANTSSSDLLSNEVSSVDPVLANSFNQKIPFRVVLKLTGVLSRPTIAFDIQLPDEDSDTRIGSDLRTTIENKLAQIRGDESATNKQVFSLLLLNRFVGEQSSDFFSGSGGGFNDLARQSVSQFLSSALDQIAGDLFMGIDVDLNLNSYQDYSGLGSQQRTDLNLALSKSFLDDRLVVTVGTNIGIEGSDPASKGGGSSYVPDVNLAYKLSKDGKYMLRAYRRNQFEVLLDGYMVETGVGFLMSMDYEKFNELFRKRKKK